MSIENPQPENMPDNGRPTSKQLDLSKELKETVYNPEDYPNDDSHYFTLAHLFSLKKEVLDNANPVLLSQFLHQLAVGFKNAENKSKYVPQTKKMIEEITEIAARKITEFNPQGIANILWSMANVGHADEKFMNIAIKEAEKKITEFNPQNLANILWSMATLGHADEKFMDIAIKEAEKKITEFNPQNLANILWAMATLGHADEKFMDIAIKEATKKITDPEFKPQAISNILWSMATLGHTDEKFMDIALKEAERKITEFKPQELANTLWSMATLGHTDEKFMDIALKEAERKITEFKPQELANTLWSMAVLNYDNNKNPYCIKLINHSILPRIQQMQGELEKFDDFKSIELLQIYQGLVHFDLLNQAPKSLKDKFNHTINENINQPSEINDFEYEVINLINDSEELKNYVIIDQFFSEGYFIDIALTNKERTRKIAVECEGVQFHYINGKLKLEDRLRKKILNSAGWEIYRIRSDDFNRNSLEAIKQLINQIEEK